jgi:hypothetical protein
LGSLVCGDRNRCFAAEAFVPWGGGRALGTRSEKSSYDMTPNPGMVGGLLVSLVITPARIISRCMYDMLHSWVVFRACWHEKDQRSWPGCAVG